MQVLTEKIPKILVKFTWSTHTHASNLRHNFLGNSEHGIFISTRNSFAKIWKWGRSNFQKYVYLFHLQINGEIQTLVRNITNTVIK